MALRINCGILKRKTFDDILKHVTFEGAIKPLLDIIRAHARPKTGLMSDIVTVHRLIRSIPPDELFFSKEDLTDIVNGYVRELHYTKALQVILENTYWHFAHTIEDYKVEISESGAILRDESYNEDIFVSEMMLMGLGMTNPDFDEIRNSLDHSHEFVHEFGLLKEEAKEIADAINNEYRIFRCKDCGRLTYVKKSEDERMRKFGLSPRKRCFYCVSKRKGNWYGSDYRASQSPLADNPKWARVNFNDIIVERK